MARKKPPSFDFFVDDFIAGTYHLPAEAVGIYVRLLCFQWNNGSIPGDHEQLSRIAGVDTSVIRTYIRIVYEKFEKLEDGSLQNERMERERSHRLAVIEKSKAAIESRWSKQKTGKTASQTRHSDTDVHTDVHTDVYTDVHTDCIPPTPNSQHPTPNKDISHTHTPSQDEASEIVIPKELSDLWPKWTKHFLAKTGRMMSGVQQEVILMDLAKRGWDKARADIEFSIRIGASAVRDSDNDFDKPTRAGSGSSRSGSRKSKAERMNELL